MSEMTVVVNGEERRVPGPATLLDLLRHLGLDPRTVDYHGRKGEARLRNLLGLPATQSATPGRKEEAQ